jgi:Protein of unknown function (DUF3154).
VNFIKAAMGPILEGILRFIPDKNARAEAKEMFEGQMLNALTGLVQGQLDINKEEAKHTSIFVAGWRPFIGWVCGVALVWNFIIQPLLLWVAWMMPELGIDMSTAPKLDSDELMTVLLGMLGLGGLRTYEKRLGVDRSSLKKGDK